VIKLPEWNHWRQMPHAELWECVALSCGIEPRKTDASNLGPYGIDARYAGPSYSYDRRAVESYQSRIDIASAHLNSNGLLRPIGGLQGRPRERRLLLPAFVRWAVSMGWEMPVELCAIGKAAESVDDAHDPLPTENDQQRARVAERDLDDRQAGAPEERKAVEANNSIQDATAGDAELTFVALFDPVKVKTLEKMFPASGKWKNWVERAKSNKLIDARVKRGYFNPYRAALWFLQKGIEDWDLARCHRVLAKNLPARSRDNAHLLTGELE
jgi:hypothetical protein